MMRNSADSVCAARAKFQLARAIQLLMATKSRTRKSAASKSTKPKSHKSGSKRRWSAQVTATSDATHPPDGLFKKDAATIARTLASKKVSPKGVSSGMRMLSFYINRAGKNLPQSRLKVLEKAKQLLHQRVEREKKKAA
jgi:Protein of unknown function (DUF3175)